MPCAATVRWPRTPSVQKQKSRSGSSAPSSTCSRRSEEHTSELQSQSNLVCRLLLEKKKNVHALPAQGVPGDQARSGGGGGLCHCQPGGGALCSPGWGGAEPDPIGRARSDTLLLNAG